jgi:hypothetical protein
MTDFGKSIVHEITRGEEWKRKNLVANLPSDFDPAFWGSGNILDPTTAIQQIIASIAEKNKDTMRTSPIEGWLFLNPGYFVANQNEDRIGMIPIAKSSWEDDQAGGLLYKMRKEDFRAEAKLTLRKRTNPSVEPDNGFQQCGIMIRSADQVAENNIMLALGTGGNSVPKYFVKNTINGKTKSTVGKMTSLTAWLRVEKQKDRVLIYLKKEDNGDWEKLNEFRADWLKGDLQVGFSVMARFTGDGPKQRPDIKAEFSHILITDL